MCCLLCRNNLSSVDVLLDCYRAYCVCPVNGCYRRWIINFSSNNYTAVPASSAGPNALSVENLSVHMNKKDIKSLFLLCCQTLWGSYPRCGWISAVGDVFNEGVVVLWQVLIETPASEAGWKFDSGFHILAWH